MTKELKDLRHTVESQGWTVERSKSNHWKFIGPKGQLVVVGHTISDWRGLKNAKMHLRQAGCKV